MRRVLAAALLTLGLACSPAGDAEPAASPASSGGVAPAPAAPAASPESAPSPPAEEPQPSPAPTVVDARPRPSPTPSPNPTPVPEAVRYSFPIDPAGAASYGREHHDYPATDLFADCGTPVVAIVGGIVEEVSRRDRWDPVVNDGATRGGKSVSIIGDDGVRYYGSHFSSIDGEIQPGSRVVSGQRLGRVGRTGSARETPCHLHLGFSPPRGPGDWEVRRGVVFPWPYLDSWRTGGQRSPVREVRRWGRQNPE